MTRAAGIASIIGLLGAAFGLAAGAGACGSSSATDTAGSAAGGSGGGSGASSGAAGSSTGGGISVGSGGQGGTPSCAEASAAVVASPVDVILAVDQSASMGEEIQGVVSNLNTNLVQILQAANIDYRVVFVAGVNGLPTGPLFRQIDHPVNSSDALTLLLWTYGGEGRAANTCDRVTNAALAWNNFVRLDSHKVFVVVSDDDPSSFDCAPATTFCNQTFPGQCSGCANGCAGYCPMYQCPTYADKPAAWGGGDFPSELYKLAPAGTFGDAQNPKWTLHAIVPVAQQLGPGDPITPLGQVCNVNGNTGETSGVEYQKLAVMSGGLRFPSCDTDYSPVFQTIANTIVPLACKLNLQQTSLGTPDPDKTNVEIDYGDGMGPTTILRDDTAPCGSGADGWQFADGGQSVVLCGAACDKLKASPNASVDIVVGCETQVK